MKISTNFQDPLIKIVPDFFYPIKSGPFTWSDFATLMIAESLSVNGSLVVKNTHTNVVEFPNNVTTILHVQFPQAKCVQLATP